MISFILSLLCGLLFLAIDQYTKHIIVLNFELNESREFLKGFIDLTYIHNRGGAWGMLSGNTWLLVCVSVVVMLGCMFILIKYAFNNKLLHWALNLVLFGGLGNMIDRVFKNGNVVDFLHFEFWPQFPVFNIADCAIVLGTGLLILYFLIDTINEYKQKKSVVLECEELENGDN